MGCILYISTFWQDGFHLYSQVSSCRFCICAELPSTASVLCVWHLEREKLTLEAAFNTYRVLRDTATPRNYQVGSVIPKEVLFPAWDSGDAMWTGVDKLLLEGSMTRGHWLKGNTILYPEHLHGLSVGAFLKPSCQHPSRSEECFVQWPFLGPGMWAEGHVRKEKWRKRALVNHLKYTSFFRVG